MAVGEVYELTDVQMLQGQRCLNVYFYVQQVITVPLAGQTIARVLLDNWQEQILPEITPLQTGDLTHTELRVRNLTDVTDVASLLISVPGSGYSSSVNSAPSFTAISFQLGLDAGGIKPGGKRVGGVHADSVVDGVMNAGYVTAADGTADALEAAVGVGLVLPTPTFFPVVVKRVREGAAPDYTYRLPETSGELVFANIINVLFDILISSQVSRKWSVGD